MNKRGWTLVELVMMIALGGVLVTGLSLGIQTQIKTAVDQRDYLVALNLAKLQMAAMNNSSYPAVASEAALTTDPDYPSFIVTQEVVSVATNGSNSLREIRVRVRRDSIGGEVLVDLRTYRSDILTFGDGV